MISWISLDYTDWGAAAQVRGAARASGRSISMQVLTTAPGALPHRCEAQLVRQAQVTAAKRFRSTIKRSLALEKARQRLMIHLSTLAEPTLKPNKAVEATDRRRLLGDLEIPQLACSTVQVG